MAEPYIDGNRVPSETLPTETSGFARIAPLIDAAARIAGDTSLTTDVKAERISEFVSNAAVTDVLGTVGMRLQIIGNTYSFIDQHSGARSRPLGDGVGLLEELLEYTYSTRTEPVSKIKERWPKLIVDRGSDIGHYLFERGIKPGQSSWVRMLETHINETQTAENTLRTYLNNPDKTVSVLSFSGSTAIVFTDDNEPVAYKVYKGRMKKDATLEVHNLHTLQETGLTPQLIDSNVDDPETETVVTAMERIDSATNLQTIDPSIRRAEATRITDILYQARLMPFDMEPIWDDTRQQVRIIDAGGFYPLDESGSPTRETIEKRILKSLHLSEE